MPAGPAWATSRLRFLRRPAGDHRSSIAGKSSPSIRASPAAAGDPRFDGFRRNWLGILQLNPRLRVLANHAGSDSAAFCYYEYADIARYSPPLAEGLGALDLVRQSLDRVLEGVPAYGMPNYVLFDGDYATALSWFREASADTYPSLLISAWDYFDGTHDKAWLAKNYAGIRQWAEKMLATDRNGNGLIEYVESGNSGSWPARLKHRPSNWWDAIGFGHEDAYANALAYRALARHGTTGRQTSTRQGTPPATAPPPTSSAKPTSRPSTIRPPACWRAGRAPTANSTTTISSSSTASPSITGWSPGTGPTPSWTGCWPR